MGSSCRTETGKAPRAYNFGRVAIAMGFMSYKSWKGDFPWQEKSSYHLEQWMDAMTSKQTLAISKNGKLIKAFTGDIAYFTPSLTTDGLYLHVGANDKNSDQVSPHGWTFSNLVVTAQLQ